ncbi:hypothetical protein GCM10010261_59510 [Streptomyces pilosus]|nr:hypothetical protein GCM10010261_59510 [Streptomyces pilosus]
MTLSSARFLQAPLPERKRPDHPTRKLVNAVFKEVTSLHVSRPAAWALRVGDAGRADGDHRRHEKRGGRGCQEEADPQGPHLATDRNVEAEAGSACYLHSPTFHGLIGELRNADGALVSLRERRGARTPNGVAGTHRFEAGVRSVLRSRG